MELATYIREQIDNHEKNHDYTVATDTIKCWIDEFKRLQNNKEFVPKFFEHDLNDKNNFDNQ